MRYSWYSRLGYGLCTRFAIQSTTLGRGQDAHDIFTKLVRTVVSYQASCLVAVNSRSEPVEVLQ